MIKILLVDDEAAILTALSALLKTQGYEITASLGGDAAKNYIVSEAFDLMISDIRMAPIDGIELLRYAHEKRPNMPVIMLTAYGHVETAIEALELGAFDYVKKPFKTDELLNTIRSALACHDYNRES